MVQRIIRIKRILLLCFILSSLMALLCCGAAQAATIDNKVISEGQIYQVFYPNDGSVTSEISVNTVDNTGAVYDIAYATGTANDPGIQYCFQYEEDITGVQTSAVIEQSSPQVSFSIQSQSQDGLLLWIYVRKGSVKLTVSPDNNQSEALKIKKLANDGNEKKRPFGCYLMEDEKEDSNGQNTKKFNLAIKSSSSKYVPLIMCGTEGAKVSRNLIRESNNKKENIKEVFLFDVADSVPYLEKSEIINSNEGDKTETVLGQIPCDSTFTCTGKGYDVKFDTGKGKKYFSAFVELKSINNNNTESGPLSVTNGSCLFVWLNGWEIPETFDNAEIPVLPTMPAQNGNIYQFSAQSYNDTEIVTVTKIDKDGNTSDPDEYHMDAFTVLQLYFDDNKIEDGDVIKLETPVTLAKGLRIENKSFTIDLAGNKLETASDATKGIFIYNSDVAFVDSVGDGTIECVNSSENGENAVGISIDQSNVWLNGIYEFYSSSTYGIQILPTVNGSDSRQSVFNMDNETCLIQEGGVAAIDVGSGNIAYIDNCLLYGENTYGFICNSGSQTYIVKSTMDFWNDSNEPICGPGERYFYQ